MAFLRLLRQPLTPDSAKLSTILALRDQIDDQDGHDGKRGGGKLQVPERRPVGIGEVGQRQRGA